MKRGDVVIVDVDFVGASGSKKRPALVIQNDVLNAKIKETIIASITSNVSNAHQPDQLFIDLATDPRQFSFECCNSSVELADGERAQILADDQRLRRF